MNEYKITATYVTHDTYDTYEDDEGRCHEGRQISQFTANDPYYTVVEIEDDYDLADFDTYEEAKAYIEQLEKENSKCDTQ